MQQRNSLFRNFSDERILRETSFSWLGEVKRGKVRDMYFREQEIVFVSTDRHSSFDRIIAHIPLKGQVLNLLSAWWFSQTRDIVPNHVAAVPDPNVTIGKRCSPIPVEMVVRGYITGVTQTSLWTRYQKGERDFGTFTLLDGMKKNQRLAEPVLTPTTKQEDHDRNITPEEIVSEGLADKGTWEQMAAYSRALFQRGQEVAESRGLILVDTKYEFGRDEDGNIILIDEIHTPDSSRYWKLDSYEERFARGEEPEYFDKEFLRLWFKEHCDPYADTALPEAPPEMVAELAQRYVGIYEQITGEAFPVPDEGDVVVRVEQNLKSYFIT